MTSAVDSGRADVRGGWHDGGMALPTLATALVGRDEDLAAARAAFIRAQEGEPGALLLCGEAGIGKSRLIRELQSEFAGTADLHIGWCLDLGAARTPYGPLTAVLRSLIAVLGADAALAAVGTGAAALRMLLPELTETPVDRASTSPEGLRDAIATLIEAAADRAPQVLVIEDLHWADASTLMILSFLIRTLGRGRILFLLSFRTDDVRRGEPASRFIADLARVRHVERLTLERLGPEATRALGEQIRGIPVTDEQLDSLAARAEGVPFFIEELSCCLDGAIPDGLRDVLLARFDALGDDARQVVRVASASADGVLPHTLLAHLVGLEDQAFDTAVRAGIESGVLSMRGDGYGFRHALLREAVHDDLLPGERSRLHWDYAQALEDGFSGRIAEPSTMAFHWQRAHDPRRALRAAVTAMFQAKASYAFASSARFGELALELWDQAPAATEAAGIDRTTLLHRLGSILRNAGESDRALAVVELALSEMDERTIAPEMHVRLVRDRAQYLAGLGRPGALELFVDAAELIERYDIIDGHLRATVLLGIASRHMLAGRAMAAVIAATAAARAAGDDDGDVERSIAFNLRACSLMLLGEFELGQLAFDEAGRLARDDRRSGIQYRLNLSDSLTLRGRYHEAVEIAEHGLERARSLGVERSTGGVMIQNMIEPLLALGEISRVEALLAGVDEGLTALRFGLYLSTSRVRALAWRGLVESAERIRREWRPALQTASAVERQVWYYLVEVDVAIATARGDWRDAVHALIEMVRDSDPAMSNQRRLLLEGGWIVASARAAGVETDAVVSALRGAWKAQPPALRDARWSVILDAMLIPTREGLEAVLEAVDAEGIPAVMPVAVRLELARMLVGTGERAEAARMVTAAEARASALGHDRLQQQAAELAAAVGGRASSAAGDSELTAREQQVLALVTDGLSNRQIGERLFISAKTASVHVSAILRKLGVSTRTEAAVLAHRNSAAV